MGRGSILSASSRNQNTTVSNFLFLLFETCLRGNWIWNGQLGQPRNHVAWYCSRLLFNAFHLPAACSLGLMYVYDCNWFHTYIYNYFILISQVSLSLSRCLFCTDLSFCTVVVCSCQASSFTGPLSIYPVLCSCSQLISDDFCSACFPRLYHIWPLGMHLFERGHQYHAYWVLQPPCWPELA